MSKACSAIPAKEMSGCAAHPAGQQYSGSVGVGIVLKQDIQHADSSVSVSFGGRDDGVYTGFCVYITDFRLK